MAAPREQVLDLAHGDRAAARHRSSSYNFGLKARIELHL
jgi:hypothetical protein